MKYIDQFREGERICDIYLCKTKQVAKTKAGKSYYSLVLQDKTGTIDAKVWELNNGIAHFEALDYIMVDAEVTSYQSNLQLNVRRIRVAKPGEYTPGDYLPVSEKDIPEMHRQLTAIIGSLSNPDLRRLAESFFVEDREFVKSFCDHSAAKAVHHGFVGGLLEHTLSVVKLCDYFVSVYPYLNRDLLLCAAMFHDIGKTRELSLFPENDYTDDGQLLGHIMIGAMMVSERIHGMSGFPEKTASELVHCILAHHGELEYGSPKKPALAEALALSLADNADAKLETMKEIMSGAVGGEWMGYNRFFESNLRPTTKL
ncbi:MAG: HD domain-containing protein [Lachnospiraceae bacterium]|jgi:3'-5' exoribonuclease|nr:HD domain-containing protein [Lachnospiraceae bacterium]